MLPDSINDPVTWQFCCAQEQLARHAGTAGDALGHSRSFDYLQLLLLKTITPGLSAMLCSTALPSNRAKQKFKKKKILMNNRGAPHWPLPVKLVFGQVTCCHNTRCHRTPAGFALLALSLQPLYKALHGLLQLPYTNRRSEGHSGGQGHLAWQEGA